MEDREAIVYAVETRTNASRKPDPSAVAVSRKQRAATVPGPGRLLMVVDLLVAVGCFLAAHHLRLRMTPYFGRVYAGDDLLWVMPVSALSWLVALALLGLYGEALRDSVPLLTMRMFGAGLIASVMVGACVFAARAQAFSRAVLLLHFVLTMSALVLTRLVMRGIVARSHEGVVPRVLVIVAGTSPAHVDAIARSVQLEGQMITATLSLTDVETAATELASVLRGDVTDAVVLAVGRSHLELVSRCLPVCEELGLTAIVAPELVERTYWPRAMQLGEVPALRMDFSARPGGSMFAKRMLDLVLGTILLVISLPLLLLSGVLIKLTSRGPVLFKQARMGLNARTFTMFKLRTMTHGAADALPALAASNELDGPAFKMKQDPRTTPIGRLLRRFSIDELPQLWNVLRGDMSLVGPRPPLPEEVARYERIQRGRLSVRPGITCLWQISGRSDLGFAEWMRLDRLYIDTWSLALDLKILALTIPAVLSRRGSY